jgi:hypothetical protein
MYGHTPVAVLRSNSLREGLLRTGLLGIPETAGRGFQLELRLSR